MTQHGSSLLKKCEQRLHCLSHAEQDKGHASMVGKPPRLHVRSFLNWGLLIYDKQGEKKIRDEGPGRPKQPQGRRATCSGGQMWQQSIEVNKRKKMFISQPTGLLHLLSFSQCLPHAGFLPGQEPPVVSGIHSSSPFPSSANISGLGPKSPVFEGKNWSTSVHIRDKITARMRSDS